jgi:predicted TIM-barrel fold metal-dependent hydrolase
MRITRRELLSTVAAAACVSTLESQSDPPPDWGGPIVDTHLHLRGTVDGNHTHLQGCGVTHAVLRARDNAADQVKAIQQKYPGRFVWTASTDITKPEAESLLTRAVKAGAAGFGEIKSHVEADGPELRRMFALAADLDVSIMIHFQEVPHFDGEGVWATGFKRFEAMLKAYPKTRFIGHADAFWANVSADYANDVSYPSGPIVKGGVTDKLLADYPNLYGDLSANSGNNALSRDAAFTKDFLARHQDKLLFGSDCGCADGRGSGVAQANNPAASRLAGKCVARETLALLKRSTTSEVFRKLTWINPRTMFKISAEA